MHVASLSYSEHTNKKNVVIVNLICCGAAIAQSVYWLGYRVRIPTEARDSFLTQNYQTGSGHHPTVPAVPSTGTKQSRCSDCESREGIQRDQG